MYRVALAILLSLLASLQAASVWAQQAPCRFVLGFAAIREQIGAETVGDCLENQITLAGGDARQRTTKGELIWRKTDSVTAFTDGHRTWLIGPYGLESRLNTERLSWEQGAPVPTQAQRSIPDPQPNAVAVVPAALGPALAAIRSLNRLDPAKPIGDAFLATMDRTGVQVSFAAMHPNAGGYYSGRENAIVLNEAVLGEDARAIAAVLMHEVTHARQVRLFGEGDGRGLDCIPMEVEAYMVQSFVWGALWNNQPPRRTSLERNLTADWLVAVQAGEPGMYRRVVDSPNYQAECELWVPQARPAPATSPAPAVPAVPPATSSPSTSAPLRVEVRVASEKVRSGSNQTVSITVSTGGQPVPNALVTVKTSPTGESPAAPPTNSEGKTSVTWTPSGNPGYIGIGVSVLAPDSSSAVGGASFELQRK